MGDFLLLEIPVFVLLLCKTYKQSVVWTLATPPGAAVCGYEQEAYKYGSWAWR